MAYHEKCNCPEPSLNNWLTSMKCPSSYRQITEDLAPFQSVDMNKVEKETVSRFNLKGAHSLCHYVIKDNQVIMMQ